jgi:hypothetical protein
VIEADHSFQASGSPDMIGSDIVCHTVDPGAQRAALIERRQAAPDLQMDILQQVLPLDRVCFVSNCQTSQRGT